MVLITIVIGAFVNQLITRGPHIGEIPTFFHPGGWCAWAESAWSLPLGPCPGTVEKKGAFYIDNIILYNNNIHKDFIYIIYHISYLIYHISYIIYIYILSKHTYTYIYIYYIMYIYICLGNLVSQNSSSDLLLWDSNHWKKQGQNPWLYFQTRYAHHGIMPFNL